MSSTSKRAGGWDPQTQALAGLLALLGITVVPLTAAVHLGNRLDGSPQVLPGNPMALVLGLARGTLTWPRAATWVLAALVVVVLTVGAAAAVLVSRRRRTRSRVDRAARHMGRGRDLGELGRTAATGKATRLGVDETPGLVIAETVAGRQLLFQGWEDQSVDVWGPRSGKTTSRAIPALLEAPGAVVATSNKRDLVDATRDLRAERGDVWVFDPQGIVDEAVNMAEKQRGGVYGTAQKTAAFMTNRQAMHWVTPGLAGARRAEFDPGAFVRGRGTLYSLSKEGRGSAGPLVTALTVAVTEAAEDLAKRSPGGRLQVPLVAVLDEAANVCRWRELPNLYSHYGSRGIVMMTILQSWSQGVEVWGRDGMRKLWSAANVKVYGGGVHEREFLSELSELIGDVDLDHATTSHGRGGRSTSRSTRRERVLDVADLGALPKGRAIVIASGARPTLARTLPWMDGPHADAVRASIRAHDPAAEVTLTADDASHSPAAT